MSDYWQECVEIGLEEAGISATKEQVDILVGSVEGGHEHYGMAHGYDVIESPVRSEIDEIKARHKREIDDLNKEVGCYRAGVARRRNCDPGDVYLEGGDVMYRRN